MTDLAQRQFKGRSFICCLLENRNRTTNSFFFFFQVTFWQGFRTTFLNSWQRISVTEYCHVGVLPCRIWCRLIQ